MEQKRLAYIEYPLADYLRWFRTYNPTIILCRDKAMMFPGPSIAHVQEYDFSTQEVLYRLPAAGKWPERANIVPFMPANQINRNRIAKRKKGGR